FVRHAVEGVVDLDRRKPRRVVRQHLRGWKIRRVKASLPFRIVVPRRTNPNHDATLDFRPLTVDCPLSTLDSRLSTVDYSDAPLSCLLDARRRKRGGLLEVR